MLVEQQTALDYLLSALEGQGAHMLPALASANECLRLAQSGCSEAEMDPGALCGPTAVILDP